MSILFSIVSVIVGFSSVFLWLEVQANEGQEGVIEEYLRELGIIA